MSDAEKFVAGLEALDEVMAEANGKRDRLAAYLKEHYSVPFAAIMALRIALRSLEDSAQRAGFDLEAIYQVVGFGDPDADPAEKS
jgi:hypothetical protein